MLASELNRQRLESCSKSFWPVGHTRVSPEAVLSALQNDKERHATHAAGTTDPSPRKVYKGGTLRSALEKTANSLENRAL